MYAPKCSDLFDQYKGNAEKNTKALFEVAKESGKTTVVFLDECDSIFAKRSEGNYDYVALRNEFFAHMNDTETQRLVVLVFATNFYDSLDQAFLRRMDMKLFISEPDANARCELFKNSVQCLL